MILETKCNSALNLNTMSDQTLIAKIVLLVREERELLTSVLKHLREIENRRLFSSLGYSSLFDFTIKHLGYSEDQAYRRISAMRLLKELPEIEQKINAGSLSLSHIGLAQSFFKQELKSSQKAFSKEEKILLFERIANKPIREAARVTLSLSSIPTQIKPDKIKLVAENLLELEFQASGELRDKIDKIKGMVAHKYPNITLGGLFERLCDLGIEQWAPGKLLKRKTPTKRDISTTRNIPTTRKKPSRKNIQKNPNNVPATSRVNSALRLTYTEVELQQSASAEVEIRSSMQTSQPVSQYVSQAQIRRDVFKRANYQCQICASTFALEIDHIVPRAKKGDSSYGNLRVLCRSCNQRAAINEFGQKKMNFYLV